MSGAAPTPRGPDLCNFGSPNGAYTAGNSDIRKFYRERDGDCYTDVYRLGRLR